MYSVDTTVMAMESAQSGRGTSNTVLLKFIRISLEIIQTCIVINSAQYKEKVPGQMDRLCKINNVLRIVHEKSCHV